MDERGRKGARRRRTGAKDVRGKRPDRNAQDTGGGIPVGKEPGKKRAGGQRDREEICSCGF